MSFINKLTWARIRSVLPVSREKRICLAKENLLLKLASPSPVADLPTFHSPEAKLSKL